MPASPAEIVKRWMIAEGLGVDPATSSADWPIYKGFMPDGTGVQDDVISIRDTLGKLDGRSARTNKTFDHPGIMIQVRGLRSPSAFDAAYTKAANVFEAMDDLIRYTVVISSVSYTIQNLAKTSDLIYLGLETDTFRRPKYSMNFLVSWGA